MPRSDAEISSKIDPRYIHVCLDTMQSAQCRSIKSGFAQGSRICSETKKPGRTLRMRFPDQIEGGFVRPHMCWCFRNSWLFFPQPLTAVRREGLAVALGLLTSFHQVLDEVLDQFLVSSHPDWSTSWDILAFQTSQDWFWRLHCLHSALTWKVLCNSVQQGDYDYATSRHLSQKSNPNMLRIHIHNVYIYVIINYKYIYNYIYTRIVTYFSVSLSLSHFAP